PNRIDLYYYHFYTDWNMDDDYNKLYWDCDVEKCEYWDLDVEFAASTIIEETDVCDECNQPSIWQDGQIRGWDTDDQKWIRGGCQSVALKTINNPIDSISNLLKEIESNIQVVDDPHFIKCLGITQDSKTHNYMIVMEYATSGSLRSYMNANNMDANKKGQILWSISKGLYHLHEKNLIHQDFHPGNLLLINGCLSISDFGLCKQENQKSKSKTEKIFGVLPY
ncbi:7722_t:CDS:2, partial [Racocetra fulgida]